MHKHQERYVNILTRYRVLHNEEYGYALLFWSILRHCNLLEANIEGSSIGQKIAALEERMKKLEQIKDEIVLSSIPTLEKNQKEMMNTLTRPLINLDQ